MNDSLNPIVVYALLKNLIKSNGGSTGGGGGSTTPPSVSTNAVKGIEFKNDKLVLKMSDGSSFSAPFSDMLLHSNKLVLDKLDVSKDNRLRYDGNEIINLEETVKAIELAKEKKELVVSFGDASTFAIPLSPVVSDIVRDVLVDDGITGGDDADKYDAMEYIGRVETHSDLLKLQDLRVGKTIIVENDITNDNQRSLYVYHQGIWEWLGSLSKNRDFSTHPINMDTEVIGAITDKVIPNTIARVSQLHNHNNKPLLDALTENSYGEIMYNGKKISSFKIRDKENNVFNNISSMSLGNFLGLVQGDNVQLVLDMSTTDLNDMPKVHFDGKVLVSNATTNKYELKSIDDLAMLKENYTTTVTTEQWGSNSALGYYEKIITHNLNSKNLILAFYDEQDNFKFLEYSIIDELNIKLKSNTNDEVRVVINCSQGTTEGRGSGGGGGNLDHTHSNLDILNDFSLDKYGQLRFRQHIIYPNFDPYNYQRQWENENVPTLTELVKYQEIFNEKDIRVITASELIIENKNDITGNPVTDKKNAVHLVIKENGITVLDTEIKPKDVQKYVTGINPNTRIFIKGYFSGVLSINYFDTTATSTRQVVKPDGSFDISDYQLKIDNNLKTSNKAVVGAINELNTIVKSSSDKIDDLSSKMSLYQTRTDSNLVTKDKTIVGAINELKTSNGDSVSPSVLEKYQTKKDDSLDTIRKTVVGAINELVLNTNTNKNNTDNLKARLDAIVPFDENKLNDYQKKTSEELTTTDKTVIGGINELKGNITSNTNEVNTLKTKTTENKTAIDNLKTQVDNIPTFDEATLGQYQKKNDDTLTTTNKSIVGGVNELKGKIDTNTSEINTVKEQLGNIEPFDKTILNNYQTKVDSDLNIADGNIVKAIKENNSKIVANTTSITNTNNTLTTTNTKLDELKGRVDAITPFDESKLGEYQKKSDDTLKTDDKTVVGGINEINTKVTTANTNITANTTKLNELKTQVDGIRPFDETKLNDYQKKTDDTLTTTSKTIVGGVNELKTKVDEHNSKIEDLELTGETNSTDITSIQTDMNTVQMNITNINRDVGNIQDKLPTFQTKEDSGISGSNKNVVSVINSLLANSGSGSSFDGSYSDKPNDYKPILGVIKASNITLEDDNSNPIKPSIMGYSLVKGLTVNGRHYGDEEFKFVAIGDTIEIIYDDGKQNVAIGNNIISNLRGIALGRELTVQGSGLVAEYYNVAMGSEIQLDFGIAIGDRLNVETTQGFSVCLGAKNTIQNTRLCLGSDNNSEVTGTSRSNMIIGDNNSLQSTGGTFIFGDGNTVSEHSDLIIVGNENDCGSGAFKRDVFIFGNGNSNIQQNSVYMGSPNTENLYCQSSYITQPSDLRLKENIKDANKNIITDALKQVRIIHASYKNFEEFQGNRRKDKTRLMFDADNMSKISLFAKDVQSYDKTVTPLNDDGEPLATYTKLDDNGNEVIEPIREVIEDCKEFTPNQITPSLIVGWQAHEEEISQLKEKNKALEQKTQALEQELETIKQLLSKLTN